jgi:hypothetical protein
MIEHFDKSFQFFSILSDLKSLWFSPRDSENVHKQGVGWMLFANWLAYFCMVTILQQVEVVACKLHG